MKIKELVEKIRLARIKLALKNIDPNECEVFVINAEDGYDILDCNVEEIDSEGAKGLFIVITIN